MPMNPVNQNDHVPSTAAYGPFAHLYFGHQDGSCTAIFALGNEQVALPSPKPPSWVKQMSCRLDDEHPLEYMRAWLQPRGAEMIGNTDRSVCKSVCFLDPNGMRLALSAGVACASQLEHASIDTGARLDAWAVRKAQWRQEHERGLATGSFEPQQNDRPEISVRTASAQEYRGTA